MNPASMNLSTGASVAKFLRGRCFSLPATYPDSAKTFSPLDWRVEADPVFADRVHAVSLHDSACRVDLSGRRIETPNVPALPVINPIEQPPAYASLPEGGKIAHPERAFPVGAELTLTEDANYYGGERVPAGSKLTMAGFKTTRIPSSGRLAVGFEAVARFPDGTYRNVPESAKLAA